MNYQGSGFTLDLPDETIDSVAYTFSIPGPDGVALNVLLRTELGEGVDMNARREEVVERFLDGFDDAQFRVEDEVRARGDWQYFTIVLEFGPDDMRHCLKELHIWIPTLQPTVYVFSGTSPVSSFPSFEPVFDAMVRSFQPGGV